MTTRKMYFTKVALALMLSFILTVLLMIPALAVDAKGVLFQQDEPYQIETFDVNGPGTMDVKTSGGHIQVEGSSSNTVRVEMYVRKNGRNLLPEDTNLEDWDIDISQSGNSVKAIAKREGRNWSLFGGNDNVSISFVVFTPREMSTNLNTSGGHIEIQGLSGNQDISTSGGHLNLANLQGTIEARTSGGHIDITDIQGDVEARTSGGHIDVRNSEGNLKVRTSGGHIKLADVSGAVEASTSGGGISADFISVGKFVDLRTSGGNVDIRVPGNIGLDLNLRGSYVSTSLQNFSGEIDRDEVEGQLNGGGPKISARTSGGTVSLSFKQ
jgi:DUF4097 and DUF4098 domain-containing protein YvlB